MPQGPKMTWEQRAKAGVDGRSPKVSARRQRPSAVFSDRGPHRQGRQHYELPVIRPEFLEQLPRTGLLATSSSNRALCVYFSHSS